MRNRSVWSSGGGVGGSAACGTGEAAPYMVLCSKLTFERNASMTDCSLAGPGTEEEEDEEDDDKE